MYADTLDELHDLARRVGLKRAWFQDGTLQHYDLTPGRRAAAVAAGAVEHTRREAVEKWRELRKKRIAEIEEKRRGQD
jgi:glycine/D-amino acid oxidase-like deaminating enzyme